MIALQTNDDYTALSLDAFDFFEDGSGACAVLSVVSYGFSANLKFFFDNMETFIGTLQDMHAELKGRAVLKTLHDDGNYIEFVMEQHGRVCVSGFLSAYGELAQSLQFSFVTDQTCLPAFIEDLQRVAAG